VSIVHKNEQGARSLRPDRYAIAAIVIILLAVLIRVALLALGWPPLDSDEATIGLMGIHIAFHGAHPIFFYGQYYMGAFEAYLAAFMFRLFGVSTFTLLIGLVLLYTLFLIAIYYLACLLYSKKLALVTIALLAFGSNSMLSRELVSLGGYPDTLLYGTLLMLLSTWLALNSSPQAIERNRWPRLLAFAAWGLVAGLGLWTHLLVAPFVLAAGFLLVLFCWRELFSWAPLFLLFGLLVGAAPLIIYNLHALPGEDTITVLLNIHSASGLDLPPKNILRTMEIKGALLIAVPLATGANPICAVSDIHLFDISSVHGLHCTLVHTGWTAGLFLLWVLAVLMGLASLFSIWRVSRERLQTPLDRKNLVRQICRLALLSTSLLTFLLYVVSPDAAIFPVATSRYLIGMLVSTPAILWPLWRGPQLFKSAIIHLQFAARDKLALSVERFTTIAARIIIAFIACILFIGTFAVFTGYPSPPRVEQGSGIFAIQVNDQHLDVATTRALNSQQYALVNDLLQIGVVHLYTDYWTCNRLIFQSRERIICKVLKDHLEDGHDRYLPYQGIVESDPHASYVFPQKSLPAHLLTSRLVTDPHYRNYRHIVRDGYDIFQPQPTKAKARTSHSHLLASTHHHKKGNV
jgi:hypothetical protein